MSEPYTYQLGDGDGVLYVHVYPYSDFSDEENRTVVAVCMHKGPDL